MKKRPRLLNYIDIPTLMQLYTAEQIAENYFLLGFVSTSHRDTMASLGALPFRVKLLFSASRAKLGDFHTLRNYHRQRRNKT